MELIETGCVKRQICILKNGARSGVYYDVKNLISYPRKLTEVGDKMFSILNKDFEDCNLLCGVPYGGLPFCSYLSTQFDIPMIMVRPTAKEYGLQKQIEGTYSSNDKCVIIEDVISTGDSINKVYHALKHHVNVIGVITVLDRQENHQCEIPVKSVFFKNDITKLRLNDTIRKKGRLCFSADIENPKKLIEVVDRVGMHISICKLHIDSVDFGELPRAHFIELLLELAIKHNFMIMEDRKFVDISFIVQKQYRHIKGWADLVTVHGSVADEVLSVLSGALFVANMSNQTFDYTKKAIRLAKSHSNHIAGFITQHRIDPLICMTPGVSLTVKTNMDQNYSLPPSKEDADIVIVGRGIYNTENVGKTAELYSTVLSAKPQVSFAGTTLMTNRKM